MERKKREQPGSESGMDRRDFLKLAPGMGIAVGAAVALQQAQGGFMTSALAPSEALAAWAEPSKEEIARNMFAMAKDMYGTKRAEELRKNIDDTAERLAAQAKWRFETTEEEPDFALAPVVPKEVR
jgi:hypothetical protein